MVLRLLALLIAVVLWAAPAQAERRVALVIGNGAYQHAPRLRNPVPDAKAVAEALRRLDFDVLVGADLDKIGMEYIVKQFIRSLAGADAALLYYSGHAVEVGGQNHLIPVTANIRTLSDLILETYPLQDIYGRMEGGKDGAGARIRLLFLDACRDNPFPERIIAGSGSAAATSKGLAQVSADFGTLIAFSTAPHTVAWDGDGAFSPFTTAFLQRAAEPKTEIRKTLTKVRNDVRTVTKGQQTPWDNSSLLTEFFFVPPRPPPAFEKLSVVALRRSTQDEAVPLRLAPPRQPEGGAIRIAIETAPRAGALFLGERRIGIGEPLSPSAFAALAYQGGQAGPVTDAFSFRVEDDWNNQETGFVTVALEAAPQGVAAAPQSAAPSRRDLGRARLAGTSVLGLGANLKLAGALPAGMGEGAWLRLAAASEAGQLLADGRVLDAGRSLKLADLGKLGFIPAMGTAGKTSEIAFVAEPPDQGEIRLAIRAEIHDCDRLAGHRFDFQGVAEGVLPYEVDGRKATDACEAAVREHPNVGRFRHQLGRAYLALARNRDAFAAFEQAAALGHVRARLAIGWFHLLGAYVPLDRAKAKALFEQAAASGDVFAIHALGYIHRLGFGVDKDPAKARDFFERSARVGHTNSMNSLGELYSQGEGAPKDDGLARRYWEASAARGDVFGINNLGFVHLNGAGVPKDSRKALALFKQAAERGNPQAPNNIGRMYAEGLGVPANQAEAARWYRLGSDKGDAWAALNLGEIQRVGQGGKPDPVAAARLFARAAALPQQEPAQIARKMLTGLPEPAKLEALRRMLASLDPAAAKLPGPQLLAQAGALARQRGAEPESEALDHILIAIARAEWLGSGARIDVL